MLNYHKKGNYQDKNQEISSITNYTHHLAGTLNNPKTLHNEHKKLPN